MSRVPLWSCAALKALYDKDMELVITLLVAGALLILVETVLPGMVAGIIGACCLIAGVAEGYLQFGSKAGNLILLGLLVGMLVGCWLWVKFFPDSRVGRMFISRKVVGELGTERPELLEQTGTALTALRPAGAALIQGKRVDVVTEGQMIERGHPYGWWPWRVCGWWCGAFNKKL